MFRIALKILELAAAFYLVLAVGVNLIACYAPVPRKPVLNATLLGAVIMGFLTAVIWLMISWRY